MVTTTQPNASFTSRILVHVSGVRSHMQRSCVDFVEFSRLKKVMFASLSLLSGWFLLHGKHARTSFSRHLICETKRTCGKMSEAKRPAARTAHEFCRKETLKLFAIASMLRLSNSSVMELSVGTRDRSFRVDLSMMKCASRFSFALFTSERIQPREGLAADIIKLSKITCSGYVILQKCLCCEKCKISPTFNI